MKYTVYLLRDTAGKSYKGMTSNLERRMQEHRRGKTRTTKRMNDVQVVYSEECDTVAEARKRELYFKSSAGRRFLKKALTGG